MDYVQARVRFTLSILVYTSILVLVTQCTLFHLVYILTIGQFRVP